MSYLRLSFILLLLSSFVLHKGVYAKAHAGTFPPPYLELGTNGIMTVDGIKMSAIFFDKDWKPVSQRSLLLEHGFPQQTRDLWETEGTMAIPGGNGSLLMVQKLEPLADGAFVADYRVLHEGIEYKEMSLEILIPQYLGSGRHIVIDGVRHELPVDFVKSQLLTITGSTITIPAQTGGVTLKGKFSILIRDQRKDSGEHGGYSVRLRFDPWKSVLTDARLRVTIAFSPYKSLPLPISAVANFGFRDEIAADGKGGWTDQGAENDLRALPSGPLRASSVQFDILDDTPGSPAEGRTAIVLAGKDQEYLPKETVLSIADELTGDVDTPWKNLYLLHAAGWLPVSGTQVGTLFVEYADGTQTEHAVTSGRDIGNWWAPSPLDNAAVGWEGANALGRRVGLYVSRFELAGKPLKQIRFSGTGNGSWMIAGVSASTDDILPATPAEPWKAVADGEWVEYDHQNKINAGSVFDFSFLLDAPAGRSGHLTVTEAGHFAFEGSPSKRERFWGVNLCFSAIFLEKKDADALADRLARSGYNSVRLHHFEGNMQLKGGASDAIDPEKLDQFDYLIAALKERGIYVNIDLFASRSFSDEEFIAFANDALGESVLGDKEIVRDFKRLLPVSDLAFEQWEKFARNLLTHQNPYTGLSLIEDPVLIGICPVNEDSPLNTVITNPILDRIYRKKFEQWKHQQDAELIESFATGNEHELFYRFVYETHARNDHKMYQFLKDLGVVTPLTGSNFRTGQALTFTRNNYDYVDNHQYWDHPEFPERRWSLPIEFSQESATTNLAGAPRGIMPTRVFGKPFVVTEFNYVRPNQYRAEGGVLMPAYASLQDWDGAYNFDYSSWREGIENVGTGGVFSLASDPIGLLADRVSALLFLRGDIAAANSAIAFSVSEQTAYKRFERSFPEMFSRLGLITRIGSLPDRILNSKSAVPFAAVVVNEDEAGDVTEGNQRYRADLELIERLQSDGVIDREAVSANAKRYTSETGQIVLDAEAGTVVVTTDRSELFVLAGQSHLHGSRVTIDNAEVGGSVSVVSVDGKPLDQSSRILLVHLTDALPSGMSFTDRDRRLLTAYGRLPYLIESGSAQITLNLDPDATYRAWAVSSTGERMEEVPLVQTPEGWHLHAQTLSGKSSRLAYEIIKE